MPVRGSARSTRCRDWKSRLASRCRRRARSPARWSAWPASQSPRRASGDYALTLMSLKGRALPVSANVHVVAGVAAPDVNLAIVAGAQIGGVVRLAATQAVVGGASVSLRDQAGRSWATTSDAQGRFQ